MLSQFNCFQAEQNMLIEFENLCFSIMKNLGEKLYFV